MVGKTARLLAEIWRVRAGRRDMEPVSLLIGYDVVFVRGRGSGGLVMNTDWV